MNSLPLLKRQYFPIAAMILCVLVMAAIASRPMASTTANALDVRLDLRGLTKHGESLASGLSVVPVPAAMAALDALQARSAGPLDAYWNPDTHVPTFLAARQSTGRIPYTPSAAEIGNPTAIAQGFLNANRALFNLSSVQAELRPGRTEPDAQLNYAHVRMDQVYHGIPVFGRQLMVHMDPQEHIVAVTGEFAPGINIPAQPSMTKAQAEEVALQDLLETQLQPAERERVKASVLKDQTRLMVYVDKNNKATLTWCVTIMSDSPLGQWQYFVNARRPAVVHRFDSAEQGKQRQTYTARNTTDIPGRLLIDEGERSSDPIAQAAHDAAGKVYDYYFNTFKRDGIDDQGSTIVSTVHYGSDPQDAENAAWIGEAQQMIYGDGGELFKPLAYGLDVVGHELTHGVVDSTAQLIYEGQSGALNESYADIFGVLISGSDWTVGKQVVKSPPYPLPYLRSLSDPNAEGNYDPSDPLSGIGQPATMSEYAKLPLSRRADNGGVHINSGIPSHAAYLVAQAVGKQKMEQIYYRTMTQYLSPDSDFRDAALATIRAATDLYSAQEVRAVTSAFTQVGIDVGAGTSNPNPQLPTPGAQTPGPQTPGPTTPGPTTSGRTTPVPTQSVPAGCTNLINNGGFETDATWAEVSSSNTSIIDPELPHTGTQSAWLGGTDQESLQYIYQDVSIPANATSVKLNYYRLVHLETKGLAGLFAGDATFNVIIADTDGNQLSVVEKLSSAGGDDAWHQAQADLYKYAGKTIRLVFNAENPRGNISSLFVDDVSIAVCTTGTGPSAPPPSSQNTVYIEGIIDDADTGRGIEGAQIFILKPGVSADQAAADDTLTDDEVLTEAVADSDGVYQTNDAIARGRSYSVIVVAQGYRPILANGGMNIPANAANPYKVDATMRRNR